MVYPNNPPPAGADASSVAFRQGLSATAQFVGVGVAGLAVVMALGWLMIGSAGAGLAGGAIFFVGAMAVAGNALRASYPHRVIGLCNIVTVARLVMACALIAALIAAGAAPWAIFAVGALAFALDGLDGWLARRAGLVSAFGARFDMEVDSVLAMVLALHAFQSGAVGAYVIVLGLPRYIFWVAQFPFPWLAAPLPERFSRKVVCVLQIAALILVLLPLVPAVLAAGVAGIAALALVWSFWRDVHWLWQARA